MRELLQKVLALPTKTNSPPHKGRNKSKGQSLVEIALTLPVLLMLFASMVEFGFMLNYYMALIDATRYAAREYSNGNPYEVDPNTGTIDDWFYFETAEAVRTQLAPIPLSNDNSVKTQLNPATDDVIVTIYSVNPTTITSNIFNPSIGGLDANNEYHRYGNGSSSFDTGTILNSLGSNYPCQGILVVEVDYTYHQVLNLPWLAWLGTPVMHTDTVMPLQAAEPGQTNVPLSGAACP